MVDDTAYSFKHETGGTDTVAEDVRVPHVSEGLVSEWLVSDGLVSDGLVSEALIAGDTDRQWCPAGTVIFVCGRFTSLTPPDELASLFAADVVRVDPLMELGMTESGIMALGSGDSANDADVDRVFQPNYNVAPSMSIMVVARSGDGQRKLGRMTWGLVPSWARERRGTGHVNARSETIAEKPSFRPSLKGRRCLIPMDGYYEWRTVGLSATSKGPKRAVYIRRTDGLPMAVAGLWSTWRGAPDAPPLRTCCVITTAANTSLATVHDRMPVILDPADWSVWLGEPRPGAADDELDAALGLLVPAKDETLSMIDVGPLVNSVRNNGPELITAVRDGE